MRPTLSLQIALFACASMTSACATSAPRSVEPPRLKLSPVVTTPCRLDRLPEAPTVADLEAGYLARGEALALCDAARQLAVETLFAERGLLDRWAGRD